MLSSGLCASGLWEVSLISLCPPECISAQLQEEEAAVHPISPISTSLYPRWFRLSLGRWEMWFGSLRAEESAEARFLTSWASAFTNSSPDIKKRKVCAPLSWSAFKKSEQSSVLSSSRCLPSGLGSALWNPNGGRYFALQDLIHVP